MKKRIIVLIFTALIGFGSFIGYINSEYYKKYQELTSLGVHENYSYVGYLKSLFFKTKSEELPQVSKNNINSENLSQEEANNTCTICGKVFSGNGYEEVANGVWKECKEPYQCFICSKSCGQKHTKEINNLVNSQSTYSNKTDGKIYENNACSLCKGTGIETGKNIATGETEGRTCPMCDGKGVRGY